MEKAWISIGSTAVLAFIILIGALIWMVFPDTSSGSWVKWIYTILLVTLAIRLFMHIKS